jgi:hypothetical protein
MMATYSLFRQADGIIRAATERYLIGKREASPGMKTYDNLQTSHILFPRDMNLCGIT